MRSIAISALCLTLFNPSGFCGVDFDGDADQINCPSTAYNVIGDLTLSAWINPDDFGASNFGRIIDNRDVSEAEGYAFFLNNSSATAAIVAIVDATNTTSSNSVITLNVWQHVAFTFNDSSNLKTLYVNGIDVGNNTSAATLSANATLTKIGNREDNLREFDGGITEVAIWGAELTQDEITLLASSMVKRMPLQIQPSSLKGYLPLDDYADATVLNTDADGYKDISGNSAHCQGIDADNDSINIAEEVLSYA